MEERFRWLRDALSLACYSILSWCLGKCTYISYLHTTGSKMVNQTLKVRWTRIKLKKKHLHCSREPGDRQMKLLANTLSSPSFRVQYSSNILDHVIACTTGSAFANISGFMLQLRWGCSCKIESITYFPWKWSLAFLFFLYWFSCHSFVDFGVIASSPNVKLHW